MLTPKLSGVEHWERVLKDNAGQRLGPELGPLLDFVERARATEGGSVLVHCRHGRSRCAAVVCAVLMSAPRGGLRDGCLSGAQSP